MARAQRLTWQRCQRASEGQGQAVISTTHITACTARVAHLMVGAFYVYAHLRPGHVHWVLRWELNMMLYHRSLLDSFRP